MDAFLTSEGLLALVTLTFLEIILGVDNVIFISILSSKLPHDQQLRARRTGLIAAMVMRILLLLSIAWIIRLTAPLFTVLGQEISGRDLILIGGGLFLIGKATLEIHDRLEGEEAHGSPRVAPSFAAVIGQIMLLDHRVLARLGHHGRRHGRRHLASWWPPSCSRSAIMMLSAEPISGFVNRHPDGQGARAVVPAADWPVAHRRRPRHAHSEGLHLLRDGLLGVRRDDQPARARQRRAGRTPSTGTLN